MANALQILEILSRHPDLRNRFRQTDTSTRYDIYTAIAENSPARCIGIWIGRGTMEQPQIDSRSFADPRGEFSARFSRADLRARRDLPVC